MGYKLILNFKNLKIKKNVSKLRIADKSCEQERFESSKGKLILTKVFEYVSTEK
jgi:hypothetical protein